MMSKLVDAVNLNDYIDLYEYQRSFIDLGPRPLRFYIFKASFPEKPLCRLNPNFMWSLIGVGERKFVQIVPVTWPRWPPCLYMVKNMKHSSSLEPKGRWPWEFVCSIKYSSTINFIQMMTLGWPWPVLRQGQIWSPMLLYGNKLKGWIFQKLL